MKVKVCNLCGAKLHFFGELMLCNLCDEQAITAMGLRKDA